MLQALVRIQENKVKVSKGYGAAQCAGLKATSALCQEKYHRIRDAWRADQKCHSTPWMRPALGSASWLKAAGLMSIDPPTHASHL